ncbi:hypothetical protein AN958_11202 [Leucoagaricus sp. SymC.cos]|nr:hypothetical protein AN958_11202 [Leucoagaricus sp. SymC.cos]
MPLGVPGAFPIDMMHLLALNIPDLLLNLWRGSLQCDKTNSAVGLGDDPSTWDWVVLKDTKDKKTWTIHGKQVAELLKHLPSFYDRPPRNSAEKLYKAAEYMVYVYGYLPALLEGILPTPYLTNFYKLVRGVRLISQHKPSLRDLHEAHQCFISFLEMFETLYVQRKMTRMHFVRQCLHTLWHLAPETNRLGPPGIFAQWTMERLIGLLGQEIRLHSNPYTNLTEISIERCMVNALLARYPQLDTSTSSLPHTAILLENNYVLLHPHEKPLFEVDEPAEQAAYQEYLDFYEFDSEATICTHYAHL